MMATRGFLWFFDTDLPKMQLTYNNARMERHIGAAVAGYF